MSVAPESFSLRSLRELENVASEASIERATITVRFGSPEDFVHRWTIEDVDTDEEFNEERDGTIEAAKNRLKKGAEKAGIGNFEKAWQEALGTMTVEVPSEVIDFMDLKEAEDDIEEAVSMTEDVYEQVGRGRAISIQARVDQVTGSLDEYKNNIQKVEQNLDFEENTEGAWQEGRQRTTGKMEYFNRDGQRRGVLIWSNKVQIQEGGRGGRVIREFDNKQQAREFYKQDRLG